MISTMVYHPCMYLYKIRSHMIKQIAVSIMVTFLIGCGQTTEADHETVKVRLDYNSTGLQAEEINTNPVIEAISLEEVKVLEGFLSPIKSDNYKTDVLLTTYKDSIFPKQYNYDNEIIKEIEKPSTLYVLCNKLNQLPSSYVPEDLVEPDVRFSFDHEDEKRFLRKHAAKALEELFKVADENGHLLYALSGYRSYTRQEAVYGYWVSKYSQEEADKFSARPGHSEHQTGLTMDITSQSVGFDLTESFGEKPEGIWVKENAHRFGFIIRYAKDKTDMTLYNYEPWHLRYVGDDLARSLYEKKFSLEEYYEMLTLEK